MKLQAAVQQDLVKCGSNKECVSPFEPDLLVNTARVAGVLPHETPSNPMLLNACAG